MLISACCFFYSLNSQELDQPFVLVSWQPTITTTLRKRVLQMAASHLREHKPQLSNTLMQWTLALNQDSDRGNAPSDTHSR
jgi:hypothetical protein